MLNPNNSRNEKTRLCSSI